MCQHLHTQNEYINLIKKAMQNNDPLTGLAARGFVHYFDKEIPTWMVALVSGNLALPLETNTAAKADYDAEVEGVLQLIEKLTIKLPMGGEDDKCFFCHEYVQWDGPHHAADCPWVEARKLLDPTSERGEK